MARQRLQYRQLVAVAFMLGLFMDLLDTTIVNVALPTLGDEFDVTTSGIEWVVTAYLLSLALWIPAVGLVRRPIRHQAHLPGGPHDLHHGLAAVRAVLVARVADRLPGAAGGGGRHAHARRHRHAVPGLPARRPGQGLVDPLVGHGARPRRRGRCSGGSWWRRSTGAGSSS